MNKTFDIYALFLDSCITHLILLNQIDIKSGNQTILCDVLKEI